MSYSGNIVHLSDMNPEAALQFVSSYKRFGHVTFNGEQLDLTEAYRPYIKILLVPPGYRLTIDFSTQETDSTSLFFLTPNQYITFLSGHRETVRMLVYNRDFYCIQIHDHEVACDGLLFNNVFQIPVVALRESPGPFVTLFDHIMAELDLKDPLSEEMVRTYLKQLIIRSTRLWKTQNLIEPKAIEAHPDHELFRNFGRMLEIHFREKHSVAEYAELLNMAPKTLANKFHQLGLDNPNELIKNRILLEAKRLLTYTDLTAKEIAYQLGYDDPAYFNRFFTQKAGCTPSAFRKSTKS